MPLTKADREYIRLSMSEIMDEKLKPLSDKNQTQDLDIQELQQTVYGVNKENGLNGDVKVLKKTFNRLIGISAAAQGFAIGAGYFIKSLIGKG